VLGEMPVLFYRQLVARPIGRLALTGRPPETAWI